jgi:hypothetical protein
MIDNYEGAGMQFAENTSQFCKGLLRYFDYLSKWLLPAAEDLSMHEDDLKANTLLCRLLNSAAKGRSKIDAELLEDIQQFIGPWTPAKGEEDLRTARAERQHLLITVRRQFIAYKDLLNDVVRTSEILS